LIVIFYGVPKRNASFNAIVALAWSRVMKYHAVGRLTGSRLSHVMIAGAHHERNRPDCFLARLCRNHLGALRAVRLAAQVGGPAMTTELLDPYFGQYSGYATADADNAISRIRAEVGGLYWSAKILDGLKGPSASLARTDLRKLAEQMRETADTLDRVVDRVERVHLGDFWTAPQ
jgi:hypothetical protein